jgi:hypothetical protein
MLTRGDGSTWEWQEVLETAGNGRGLGICKRCVPSGSRAINLHPSTEGQADQASVGWARVFKEDMPIWPPSPLSTTAPRWLIFYEIGGFGTSRVP